MNTSSAHPPPGTWNARNLSTVPEVAECVSGELDRLWPDGVPQIRKEHGSASETHFVSPVTGYALDEAGNLIYLGMVGHKTVLESIRASVQARQRRKLFLQGRTVYPLATHYSQTWQHLPDYGAYHATLIADPALPSKWQPGEGVVYLLVFEGSVEDAPEEQATQMLTKRLSEALPIPILDEWNTPLWEAARNKELVVDMQTRGDCQEGYVVLLSENAWKEVVIGLMKGHKICISGY